MAHCAYKRYYAHATAQKAHAMQKTENDRKSPCMRWRDEINKERKKNITHKNC